MHDGERVRIRHKFSNFEISPNTETLIVGTFNPNTPLNKATFFYGTGRNYLWRILAEVYANPRIPSTRDEQEQFIAAHRIGFIDLISEVSVAKGQENNRDDR